MHTSAHGTPAAVQAPRTCRKHSPATARIQARLERWELVHLRELAARQAEEIEALQRQVAYLDDCADMWQRAHHDLTEHLDDGTEDARAIGLTVSGELLVVRTGSLGDVHDTQPCEVAQVRDSSVHGATQKAVILSAPAGWGKSRQAEQLRAEFGCSHVVDPWELGTVERGALHLTNADPAHPRLQALAATAGAHVVARGWAAEGPAQ